jgi:hypothetical protein
MWLKMGSTLGPNSGPRAGVILTHPNSFPFYYFNTYLNNSFNLVDFWKRCEYLVHFSSNLLSVIHHFQWFRPEIHAAWYEKYAETCLHVKYDFRTRKPFLPGMEPASSVADSSIPHHQIVRAGTIFSCSEILFHMKTSLSILFISSSVNFWPESLKKLWVWFGCRRIYALFFEYRVLMNL